MNSLERVFAAVAGNTPDRIPVSLTASLYGAFLSGSPLEEYYRNAHAYLEGQKLVAEKCLPDILFSPFALSLYAEAGGAGILFPGRNPPNIKQFVDFTPGEKINWDTERMFHHPSIEYIIDCVRLMSGYFNGKVAIAAINISPCDLPALLIGIEKWLHTLLFYPSQAIEIIQMLSGLFLETTSAMFKAGAHIVVLPGNFMNPVIVTSKIIQEVVYPQLYEIFGKVQGPLVIHHGGPVMGESLSSYNKLPNTLAYVISAQDKFQNARKLIDPGKILIGNLDSMTLLKSNPEKIRNKCQQILKDNGGEKSFIFGTSNADIPFGTPLKNILTIRDVINEYHEG